MYMYDSTLSTLIYTTNVSALLAVAKMVLVIAKWMVWTRTCPLPDCTLNHAQEIIVRFHLILLLSVL